MSTKKLQIIGELGNNIDIDTTLTQPGFAADASTVGDKFTEMTTKFDDYYLKSEANTLHTEIKDYVDTEVAALVNSAPETLDTLGELAAAFEENEEVVDVLNEAIATKYSSDNPPPYPVTSIEGKTGAVTLNHETWTFTLANGTTVTKNVVIK